MKIHQSILDFLHNYSRDPQKVDRLVTSAFIYINKLKFYKNKLLRSYSIEENEDDYLELKKFVALFEREKEEFSFEHLIKVYEFVISPSEKVVNGAVYTPKYIRDYIISETSKKLTKSSLIADISCGCGAFLVDYAVILKKRYKTSYKTVFHNNIFGVDIASYSINRTKILLSLLAISNGEDEEKFSFNLYVGDSLEFNWFENSQKVLKNSGFDVIVGNPPYVSSLNMDNTTRSLLENWSVTRTGKADLYIPFFQIGLKWLKINGVLGFITVNTFIKSLNGRALRQFFSNNLYDLRIIDFGSEQIFKNRQTYTAICILHKSPGKVKYMKGKSSAIKNLKVEDFYTFDYSYLDNLGGWQLSSKIVENNLKKIFAQKDKLGELFEIRNGFATLKNDLYVFFPEKEDENYYYHTRKGKKYKLEKAICRDAIKPNILKTEEDLVRFREKIIFPYKVSQNSSVKTKGKLEVMDESFFKINFPKAFEYLHDFKEELADRDNGNRTYPEWFAFGRSQALMLKGKKLLFPYLSDKPIFIYTDDENLLFYNGFAIISDSEVELKFIQKILCSKIFGYFINNTSKPYSSNYFSYGKNYIKNFGIPSFTSKEKKQILKYKKQSSVDNFLQDKYELEI